MFLLLKHADGTHIQGMNADTLEQAIPYVLKVMERENTNHIDVYREDGDEVGVIWRTHYTDKVLYSIYGEYPCYYEWKG